MIGGFTFALVLLPKALAPLRVLIPFVDVDWRLHAFSQPSWYMLLSVSLFAIPRRTCHAHLEICFCHGIRVLLLFHFSKTKTKPL